MQYVIRFHNSGGELDSRTADTPTSAAAMAVQLINNAGQLFDGDRLTVEETYDRPAKTETTMAYQIVQKFYQLKEVDATQDWWTVFEYYDDEQRSKRVVMRGTYDQCQAWLDEHPGSVGDA